MRIAVGADRLGRELKDALKAHLITGGHDVVDFGCSADEDVDYPDVAATVSASVLDGGTDRAVLVCGTGLGMAIAANKVRGIRAAVVSDPYSAERAAKSNNAQVLCLGAQVIGATVAPMLVDIWLDSEFDAARSGRKVAKIDALERSTT